MKLKEELSTMSSRVQLFIKIKRMKESKNILSKNIKPGLTFKNSFLMVMKHLIFMASSIL